MKIKNKEFKEIIRNELFSLINNDYVFLDLPYYTNIGDTLIWKGTEEFLKEIPYKCLYRTAIETYVTPKLKKDTIILLQGGGNFGDIWRRHTDFCLRILKEFPKNKIIMLPQTVYYNSNEIMNKDAIEMAKHPNFTICARDKITYALLTNFFSANNILLLPDMAFCIPDDFLNLYIKTEQNKALFFKRKDIELCEFEFSNYLKHTYIEEHDWPSMEQNSFSFWMLNVLKGLHHIFKKIGVFKKISGKLVDLYALKIYMPGLLKVGIEFISQYNYIYTTRLHGAILSILLRKPITFFDNSYGKNSSFYNSWLKDIKEINFIDR